MSIALSDGAVPFVISYRKILKRPKLVRKRHFVGPAQLARNLLVKAIEFFEDIAYETTTEEIDPGRSVAVHWAINVEDPWDVAPGREMNLIAHRMAGDIPPGGAHFEIISQPKAEEQQSPLQPREMTPEDYARTAGAESSHSFVRPPDPAYAPRPVAPLIGAIEEDHEDTSHLGRAGSLGEDHEGPLRRPPLDATGE